MNNAEDLQQATVTELRQRTALRSERVASAFRAVPRHRVLPNEPIEDERFSAERQFAAALPN